jgi:hypothetical protein
MVQSAVDLCFVAFMFIILHFSYSIDREYKEN